ncbi:hypothetical protein [Catellatospora sichuanensis]|nr:hypothetical protein [Catellatospora sichuanensis]
MVAVVEFHEHGRVPLNCTAGRLDPLENAHAVPSAHTRPWPVVR